MPLATLLIPMIPGLIESVWNIIGAIKDDPATPADAKAKLDQIAVDLKAISVAVQAVELPTGD